MRYIYLFVFLFLNNCLNADKKQPSFPFVYGYGSNCNSRGCEILKLEDLDGRCIKENFKILFEEPENCICKIYVNNKEVSKGYTLEEDGIYDIKITTYRHGVTRTKSIKIKMEKN